jgi:hypothetical protein
MDYMVNSFLNRDFNFVANLLYKENGFSSTNATLMRDQLSSHIPLPFRHVSEEKRKENGGR